MNTIACITKGLSVHGWPSGHALDSEEAIEFAQHQDVNCMIEEFPLEKANEAMKVGLKLGPSHKTRTNADFSTWRKVPYVLGAFWSCKAAVAAALGDQVMNVPNVPTFETPRRYLMAMTEECSRYERSSDRVTLSMLLTRYYIGVTQAQDLLPDDSRWLQVMYTL